MASDAPDSITKVRVTHVFALLDAPTAEQMMGNGRRRIIPDEMRISVDESGGLRQGYVYLEGRSVLRNGDRGPRRGVGWSVGGRWDESAQVPPWAMRVAAHIIGVPIPEEG